MRVTHSTQYHFDEILPMFRTAADMDCSFGMSEKDRAAGVETDLFMDGFIEYVDEKQENYPRITAAGRRALALYEYSKKSEERKEAKAKESWFQEVAGDYSDDDEADYSDDDKPALTEFQKSRLDGIAQKRCVSVESLRKNGFLMALVRHPAWQKKGA